MTTDALVETYLTRLEVAAVRLPPDRRVELLSEIREHIEGARAAGAAADEAAVRTLLDRLGEPEEIVASALEDVPAYVGPASPGPSRDGVFASVPSSGAPSAPPPTHPYVGPPLPPSTALEKAAVLMLTLGSLVPIVGWLVGAALLCSSRRWSRGDKLLGLLVIPGGPGLLLYAGGFVATGETCSVTVTGTAVAVGPSGAGPGGEVGPFPGPTFATDGAQGSVTDVPQGIDPGFAQGTTTQSCSGGHVLPGWLVLLLLVGGLVAPVVVAVVLHRRARARAATELPRPDRSGASPWGALEVAAVLLVGLGSFLVPVAGTVAGLVCLFLSPRWTPREKTVATLLTAVPALLGLLFALSLFTSYR